VILILVLMADTGFGRLISNPRRLERRTGPQIDSRAWAHLCRWREFPLDMIASHERMGGETGRRPTNLRRARPTQLTIQWC